eukprot:TRINITY_DN69652_c0_g1_i1.p1 TRINITY_DN69652_c0_g1~~TRINITY_DN69652_c0_g1_i1.p1  ORF type:complete len:262 (-),score=69.54 TRINITY_DN69652_c0_g1_i1:209-994(-)
MGGEGGLGRVVHKRVHLERPQPSKRRKLGILEKHSDYKKRADNYHQKQDTIEKLHRKAYFKNEDEFAFGMISKRVVEGRVRKKEQDPHERLEELKLISSQDSKYINMREQMDKSAVRRSLEHMHFLDAERPNKHTLFIDEDELVEGVGAKKKNKLRDVDVAAKLETHPSLLNRKANRPRLAQLNSVAFGAVGANNSEVENAKREAYRELLFKQERVKKLERVRQEIETRANLRKKGRRMKVSAAVKDGAPAAYKWLPDRKK